MLYVGFCPVCETGPLGIRMCASGDHAVVMCDECDAVFADPESLAKAYYPDQPDLPCPICNTSLRDPASHWADDEEVARAGWTDAVAGDGTPMQDDGQ